MALQIKAISKLLLATLQNNIETINRRIYRLAKAFGKTSYTFKNETAFLQKGALQKFMGESSSGTPKVDYMKIKKFLQSGADIDEVNEILTRMGGMKITENGEIIKTGTKVPTVGELRKEAAQKMKDMDAEEMDPDEFIESLNKFSSDFQTSYNETVKEVGAERMENDPVVGQLWMENRPGKGRLTYKQMANIMKGMNDLRADAAAQEGWVENYEDLPF